MHFSCARIVHNLFQAKVFPHIMITNKKPSRISPKKKVNKNKYSRKNKDWWRPSQTFKSVKRFSLVTTTSRSSPVWALSSHCSLFFQHVTSLPRGYIRSMLLWLSKFCLFSLLYIPRTVVYTGYMSAMVVSIIFSIRKKQSTLLLVHLFMK